jgi:hypothetical protein
MKIRQPQKRAVITSRQRRLLETGIRAEIHHYQRCLALVPNLPSEVLAAGLLLFNSETDVALWLCAPVRALGNKIPIRVAQTTAGALKVAQILRALAHGVFL